MTFKPCLFTQKCLSESVFLGKIPGIQLSGCLLIQISLSQAPVECKHLGGQEFLTGMPDVGGAHEHVLSSWESG